MAFEVPSNLPQFLYQEEDRQKILNQKNEAKIIAHQDNLQDKREFLQKVGSNIILLNQQIKYFPHGAWKIFGNLPDLSAERQRREARNKENFSKIPIWLGDRDSNPNFWDQNPTSYR